ncbi:MAG: hypothetical protein FJ257_02490 [Phycisphaerae bacterium]|nr:hypothetical protein [Phycisphaerae bacterium]
MTGRWSRWLRLAAWGIALAGAVGVASAWAVGRVTSDLNPTLQFLSWVPAPLFVLLLLAAAGIMTLAVRPRRAAAVVAAIPLLVGVDHLARRWGLPRACEDSLRIVHWNPASPGPDEAEAFAVAVESRPFDVLVISNDWWLFGRPFTHQWVGRERRVFRAGPFAMVTDLPVEEARLVVASGRRWVGMFRLAASPQFGRPLVIYVVDLPSSIRSPRREIARELTACLRDLDLPPADIVMGDFNMDFGSRSLASVFPSLRSAFSVAGQGYAGSYPREWPFWQPDQMLLAPGVEACGYRLIDLGMGTHRAQELMLERPSSDDAAERGDQSASDSI